MVTLMKPILAPLALASLPLAHLAQGFPSVPVPPGNPITPEKIDLGKALFWDEQLSSTSTISCGTCHIPAAGGSDPRTSIAAPAPGPDGVLGTPDDVLGSPGVVRNLPDGTLEKDPTFELRPQVTGRKTPSMINAAFADELFWDGRAGDAFDDPITGTSLLPFNAALESQAAGPPVNSVEMGHDAISWPEIETRLGSLHPLRLSPLVPVPLEAWIAGRTYAELFDEVFGSPDVTAARVSMAIATYERTLISDQSPFDAGALNPQEVRGRNVFFGQGRCGLCHGGPLFSDQGFHNIGVVFALADPGRFEVTGNPADRGRFKTPSLRNAALRAPYFHDGSAPDLAAVVAFYNRGGDFGFNQDPLIQPLGLSPLQRADLVAFLEALTDPRVENELPPFDRPELYSDSGLVPAPFGTPTPGTGGFAPRHVALEPASVGNPGLTVGLDDGLSGAPAVLLFDLQPHAGFVAFGATFHLAFTANSRVLFQSPLNGTGPGDGWTSVSFAVPDVVGLIGKQVFMQWIVLDSGAPGALSATRGLSLPVF